MAPTCAESSEWGAVGEAASGACSALKTRFPSGEMTTRPPSGENARRDSGEAAWSGEAGVCGNRLASEVPL
jgi:hypothetical protein